MAEREGRLKDEFGPWYPSLSPTTWYPARQLIAAVVEQLRGDELSVPAVDRLPSEHFEFRGGEAPRGSNQRTRRIDESDRGG